MLCEYARNEGFEDPVKFAVWSEHSLHIYLKILYAFLVSTVFFSKSTFSKSSFRNKI